MENKYKSTVPSLLTRCIDVLVFNIELHKKDLIFLPVHVKNNILKRINHYENLKHFFQNGHLNSILHSQTKFIDLRSIIVTKGILEMISVCTSLHSLFLGKITADETSLANLFKSLPKLTNFELRNCNLVSDQLIHTVAENCPNLVQLDIGGSKGISDISLHILCENCTFLKSLDVSHSKVTTNGIINFVCTLGSQLTDLRINNCDGVTDRAIVTILDCCPNLEILIYANCANVQDESISIKNKTPNLKQISYTISW